MDCEAANKALPSGAYARPNLPCDREIALRSIAQVDHVNAWRGSHGKPSAIRRYTPLARWFVGSGQFLSYALQGIEREENLKVLFPSAEHAESIGMRGTVQTRGPIQRGNSNNSALGLQYSSVNITSLQNLAAGARTF